MRISSAGVTGYSDHSPACQLTTLLRSRCGEIGLAYERRLRVLGIPAASDAAGERRTAELIDHTINDVVDILLQARQLMREPQVSLATRIAKAHAADGIAPVDTLAAAGALLDVVMTTSKQLFDAGDVRSPVACLDLGDPERAERSWEGPCLGFLFERTQQALNCERSRIARDLHDRVGPAVAVACQHLELYAAYAERDPVGAGQRISVAQEALRGAIDSIRHLISNLRVSQSVGGLGPALESYVDTLPADGINFCVKVNGDENAAPPHVRDEILLVVQEALRNAVAHANPSIVLANVDIMPHELRATVEDDGTGLDLDLVSRNDPGGGLNCMRERAALLGGYVTISRNTPSGTRLELRVPLEGHCDGDHT